MSALKSNQATSLCEMWMSSVARDAGVNEEDFQIRDLIALLEKKSGWDD